jgi:deoxyadenosine/deoxycytidine kinase
MSDISVIIVDGNIGSGKTSFLDAAEDAGYRVFRENLPKMQPFLKSMYKDAGRSSDMLQVCVAVEQMRVMREIEKLDARLLKKDSTGAPVVLVERWLSASEHVFIKAACMCDHISISPEVVGLWRDMVTLSGLSEFKIARYIYIRTSPAEAHARIIERSKTRTSEDDMQLEYIDRLHRLYENLFCKTLRAQTSRHYITIIDNNERYRTKTMSPEVLEDALLCPA